MDKKQQPNSTQAMTKHPSNTRLKTIPLHKETSKKFLEEAKKDYDFIKHYRDTKWFLSKRRKEGIDEFLKNVKMATVDFKLGWGDKSLYDAYKSGLFFVCVNGTSLKNAKKEIKGQQKINLYDTCLTRIAETLRKINLGELTYEATIFEEKIAFWETYYSKLEIEFRAMQKNIVTHYTPNSEHHKLVKYLDSLVVFFQQQGFNAPRMPTPNSSNNFCDNLIRGFTNDLSKRAKSNSLGARISFSSKYSEGSDCNNTLR